MRFEYYVSKLIKKMRLRSILNSCINKTSSVASGSQFVNSTMGRHSFCGYDCTVISTDIGSFCSIANNCEIGGASHTVDWVSTSPAFNENRDQIKMKFSYHKFTPQSSRTTIGNDVWIGARALIKSGVTIGHGAIIGMGSVVTKDIPPYEIWAGNPAKFIKKRFSDDLIRDLLESEWWMLDDVKLTHYANFIQEPHKFIQELKKK